MISRNFWPKKEFDFTKFFSFSGIAFAFNTKTSYMMLFDWIYPGKNHDFTKFFLVELISRIFFCQLILQSYKELWRSGTKVRIFYVKLKQCLDHKLKMYISLVMSICHKCNFFIPFLQTLDGRF